MTPRSRVRRAAALLLLPIVACARSVPVEEPSPASGPLAADTVAGVAPILLEIENTSNYDVRVYVLAESASPRRLGLVTSQRTGQFVLGDALVGRSVQIRAEPVGLRRNQTTDRVLLRPGLFVRVGLEREMRSHTLVYY